MFIAGTTANSTFSEYVRTTLIGEDVKLFLYWYTTVWSVRLLIPEQQFTFHSEQHSLKPSEALRSRLLKSHVYIFLFFLQTFMLLIVISIPNLTYEIFCDCLNGTYGLN